MCNFFFDANRYSSVFTKKALKKPELAEMWLATWRDSDGHIRHDLLYKATTNNQAEYGSMLMALNHVYAIAQAQLMEHSWLEEVTIYGDSQLVIYQLNGQYKVKDSDLKPLWLEAINLVHVISHMNVVVKFAWVPREYNNEALGLEDKSIEYNEDEVTNETNNVE